MKRRLLTAGFMAFLGLSLSAQVTDVMNYRTIDGSSNNLSEPTLGAAHTPLRQFTIASFSDGISTPAGAERPNPRTISNELFDQDSPLNDPMGLSDFIWVWGQFLDHDIGLTPDGPESLNIQVPAGDPDFDPFGMGLAIIPMHRNIFDPNSGTSVDNPRAFVNEITAFIDGSGVYGSDLERANWLRTFEGGKLKVSAGNLLPYNTVTGEFDAEIDPDAPFMDNPTAISDKFFVAGDARASENPVLAAMHTLFVLEHNRQCDRLAELYPNWGDEQLYQYARKIVGGFIQSIVYDEWLPAMGVILPEYEGYDPQSNPQMMNVFTAAAFRVGHTLLSSELMRLDNDGQVLPQGNLSLRDAFFNPFAVQEVGGIDPYLKGMGVQVQQEFDARVVDDIRNFLFGQPGFGGLDLASININRGRERGLPDYNTVRENFGLPRYNFFQQINPDAAVFTRLLSIYDGDIDDMDAWVGMLAERPLTGSIFGQTITQIMVDQFSAVRDGDRFYYEIDPMLTETEKEYIQTITLRDIIMYNSSINLMQDNVFGALPHEEICDNMTINLSGLVRTSSGEPVNGVNLQLTSTGNLTTQFSNPNGQFAFSSMPFCDLYLLLPVLNEDILNGVSTFDIIQIQKHILNIEPFDDPYQHIAADINKSGAITTSDLIRLRKVILGIDPDFGTNTSWRFVLGSYDFLEGENPLEQDFPEWVDFQSEHAANYNSGFIAVKIGDVNGSATPGATPLEIEERDMAVGLQLSYTDREVAAGEIVEFDLALRSDAALAGWQFALTGAEWLAVSGDYPAANLHLDNDLLRMSWYTDAPAVASGNLRVRMQALTDGRLSDLLKVSTVLLPEAYSGTKIQGVALQGQQVAVSWEIGQNQPNPVVEHTFIPIRMAETQMVSLRISTLEGKQLWQAQRLLEAGAHNWLLDAKAMGLTAGTYIYTFSTASAQHTARMVVQ